MQFCQHFATKGITALLSWSYHLSVACFKGGIPVQVAAWEQQAWQSVYVQVDEGTHRPQSLSASLPEAVLPAVMQPAEMQPAVAAPKQNISISNLQLKVGEDKSYVSIQRVCAKIITGAYKDHKRQQESRLTSV